MAGRRGNAWAASAAPQRQAGGLSVLEHLRAPRSTGRISPVPRRHQAAAIFRGRSQEALANVRRSNEFNRRFAFTSDVKNLFSSCRWLCAMPSATRNPPPGRHIATAGLGEEEDDLRPASPAAARGGGAAAAGGVAQTWLDRRGEARVHPSRRRRAGCRLADPTRLAGADHLIKRHRRQRADARSDPSAAAGRAASILAKAPHFCTPPHALSSPSPRPRKAASESAPSRHGPSSPRWAAGSRSRAARARAPVSPSFYRLVRQARRFATIGCAHDRRCQAQTADRRGRRRPAAPAALGL